MSDILCASRASLFPLFTPEGFFPFNDAERALAFLEGISFYEERTLALEQDPYTKQIIPQICLCAEGKLFVHRIPKSGGDSRLHDKHTIFLGGHVERKLDGRIMDAVVREFREEISYPHPYQMHALGLVNSERDEISRSHIGLVYVFHGEFAKFEHTADEGVADGQFISLDCEIQAYPQSLNSWSIDAFCGVRNFCLQLRPLSMLRSDAERLALYESNPFLLSDHWPMRYKEMRVRENAEKLRADRVPLVVQSERIISERCFRVTLLFKGTGLEAEKFTIGFRELDEYSMPTGAALESAIFERVKRFVGNYQVLSEPFAA